MSKHVVRKHVRFNDMCCFFIFGSVKVYISTYNIYIYKCHYCEFNMHLHLFMICVHVFVKVEITRSEVAAQTIQFSESFS